MAKDRDRFSFEISLNVLNNLGRKLYRSVITVLGEAISNSWDADAENVWIYIDKENNSLIIKDDGDGMDKNDFQGKFLKIGYSKRKSGETTTKKGRPYIGRKGIGKLALLSCARRISILTKTENSTYVGGVIDNSGLDKAIKKDMTPDQYQLDEVDDEFFQKYKQDHKHGTIIYFENINDGIKNSTDYLKKLIALYFRFSLLDNGFNIYINDDLVTLDHLNDLANDTQFAWNINELHDPYLEKLASSPKLYKTTPVTAETTIKGFIASVELPSQLKIKSTDEKVTVDLFVNGRLREKDILKHIPTTRVVESYLYGQIHFNELDDEEDRFASSREGIVADDPKYKAMLKQLKEIIARVMSDWDEFRNEVRDDGDPDNTRYSKRERKSRELYNIVSKDYSLPQKSGGKGKVDGWVDELANDAQFNFSSYAECFISENLMRKYIQEKKVSLSSVAQSEITRLRDREIDRKTAGNINIDLRQNNDDLSYLDMTYLAKAVDPQRGTINTLDTDAKEYKPIRDALAHTALLTNQAKIKLTSVYENMKARIKALLSSS
jgi:hypothetical protein